MSLRDEQRDALVQLAATRDSGGHRGLLLMAPSLGKTRIAAEDAANYMATHRRPRILYAAHRESILLQAAQTFHRITGITDIGFAMSGRPVNLNAQLVMASIPFLYNRLDSLGRHDFDYGVHDESHHDPAPTFRAVLEHFDTDFWLGMTGSEDRLDRQSITGFYGEPVYSLPFARALARGLFPPIDYHLIANGMGGPFDFDPRKRVSIDRINREFFGPGDDFTRLPHIARYMNSLPPAQATLYFLMGTMSADEFHSHIGGEIMHSQLTHEQNTTALERFTNGISRDLVTVDMVSEGTDIPRVDRMGMIRRTLSKSRWIQWMGRGLREAQGKEGLSVYDFAGNVERILMLMELVGDIEREAQLYRDETGDNGRDILGSSFRFHFDDTAVNIVVAVDTAQATNTSRGNFNSR